MTSGIIGVPTTDTARHSAFYEQLLRMTRPPDTRFHFVRGASVSENRNAVLRAAHETHAPWVFFLDDDMIPDPGLLLHLLAQPAVPVLSALYVSRVTPFIPMAFHQAEPSGAVFRAALQPAERGVQEVVAAGAGAMLVRPIVWETLTPPWFTLGQIAADSWGDDLHFCKKVRDAGLKVYVDYDTSVGHLGVMGIWPSHDKGALARAWYTDLVQNGVRLRLPAATEAEVLGMPTRTGA